MHDRRPARGAGDGVPDRPEADHDRSREAKRRERFVRSLVRSTFGRHYWDADLEADLRSQMKSSKQRFRK